MKRKLQPDIWGNGVLSDGVREYVTRRLGLALDRFDHRIDRVQVRLEDVNGPRGGEDKRCRVQVSGSAWRIQVEGVGASFEHAIDAAAARARRSVSGVLDRLADHRLHAVA
ncbi:MAG TPA: HPF/RaiA family ribosome-associated protein [Gemmatimonadales bacterium]|nr:HPF/RaiA family ribosome-associated protein [Gemmatimonadales bacterium]